LRQLFDYVSDKPVTDWQPGMRVKVNFANRECIAWVIQVSEPESEEQTAKLKSITSIIDEYSLITEELFKTLVWVSRYYHHPIGEVFQTALPKGLRNDHPAILKTSPFWRYTHEIAQSKLGEKQQACLDLLQDEAEGISQTELTRQLGNVSGSLKSLEKKGLIVSDLRPTLPIKSWESAPSFTLNEEQQAVMTSVWESKNQFSTFLLEGVTGSGKTEVYLQLTQRYLDADQQVLILIPEIGLTTQFVNRFKQRLNHPIVVLNSAISTGDRKQAWLLAQSGLAKVIIGTRSAVFTPLLNPGLVIIDEEHDSSYKQQDSLRYHARQVALMRAQKWQIPILLGSATPSLSSFYQVQQKRYTPLLLTQRATGATLPKVQLLHAQHAHHEHGLTPTLIEHMKRHLSAGNQVILFINRRGFAPVLMCHECQWQAKCAHCDARQVVHKQRHILFCHHCGHYQRLIDTCPSCHTSPLHPYGVGTEKIEHHLSDLFPDVPVIRVDRDTTQRVDAFSELLEQVHSGQSQILVGTQMLAKGHDFHDVTMVGILDADQGLFSADFRATEQLAQMITQVTGRAGRGQKAGEVFIQTIQPENPFWSQLLNQGYHQVAQSLLDERASMGMPPAANWIVIRAESQQQSLAMAFLENVQTNLQPSAEQSVMIMGPVPAIMEKKAGRYRAQLLLMSEYRKHLHQLIDDQIHLMTQSRLTRKVRWSIDVDPLDLL
jgi:primosomal protein N' (replication factor Y)